MPANYPLLDAVLDDPAGQAWAILVREGQDAAEVLVGDIEDIDLLAHIPPAREGMPILTLVPFRQIAERGFDAHDDGTPLRVLASTAYERVSVSELAAQLGGRLPDTFVEVTDEHFSVSDDDSAQIVTRVIEDEIGNGEGANFVIRRDVLGHTEQSPSLAALTWLRSLLTDERNAYWTFAVHTPGHTLVGATPERHVSVQDGRVRMNPISGTFRHPAEGSDELETSFNSFIKNAKETEEPFMVVDEEMKMMAQICTHGGRITGPYLKQMAHLTHTEYLLDGQAEDDPRDVLRLTMFAPTVTGSPMENACTVIARHESGGRGYYAGVLALLERDAEGEEHLDAPILIRTAHIFGDGVVKVSAGATLVRHSDPVSEVAETTAKASGMLAALGLRPRRVLSHAQQLGELPGVERALAAQMAVTRLVRRASLTPPITPPRCSNPSQPAAIPGKTKSKATASEDKSVVSADHEATVIPTAVAAAVTNALAIDPGGRSKNSNSSLPLPFAIGASRTYRWAYRCPPLRRKR